MKVNNDLLSLLDALLREEQRHTAALRVEAMHLATLSLSPALMLRQGTAVHA